MRKKHQPIHLYFDNQIYFVTSHVYKNSLFLRKDHKILLHQKISLFLKEFGFKLYAYAILDDHYHLLIHSSMGKKLAKAIGKIHAGFFFEVNTLEDKRGRRIWQNYWDRCIRDEKDFWTHFNYIHHNPVKHGLTTSMKEYEYSSHKSWIRKKGEEWIMSLFEQYPIIDFTVSED